MLFRQLDYVLAMSLAQPWDSPNYMSSSEKTGSR
jgi:hypothetical protein